MLEKEKELRYQTATEIRADLKRLKRDTDAKPSGATQALSVETPALRTAHPGGWRNWAIGAMALIALAAVCGYIVTRPVSPPRVLRTTQLSNTNRPKSGVVTNGLRLYFVDGLAGLSPPLIMAWDFFIFLSSNAAAGGRSETVVAKSDMAGAPNFGMDFCPEVHGGQIPDSAMDK